MRVGAQHPARIGDLYTAQCLLGRSSASRLEPGNLNTSATCRPTRIAGLSARPGSWYTIETVPAPELAKLLLSHAATSLPFTAIEPATQPPIAGQVAGDRESGSRLPTAGLADEPEALLARDLERDVAQGEPLVAADPVGHVEVTDFERRRPAPLEEVVLASASPVIGRALASIESEMRFDGHDERGDCERWKQRLPPISGGQHTGSWRQCQSPSPASAAAPRSQGMTGGNRKDRVPEADRELDEQRAEHVRQDLDEHNVRELSSLRRAAAT